MSSFLKTYNELRPQYENLATNVLGFLETSLKEQGVSIFKFESRIKEDGSIKDKISRYSYKNPNNDIEDFCGVRVVCYYQEDIKKICELVEDNFEIIREDDKKDKLADNQFGYVSHHYIVKLKPEWLGHPFAKKLGGLKAEIQIRTMLMHAWSAISHKLLYNKNEDVPSHLKRKLNRLSALIELADEQFDQIKSDKNEYQSSLANPKFEFNLSSELNSDTLIAIKYYYFNDRNIDDSEIPNLLDEIRSCGFTLYQFVEALDDCLEFLPQMEKDEANIYQRDLPAWNFSGIVRTVLDISCPEYFQGRAKKLPSEIIDINNKYVEKYESNK